jgi:7-keto-8-aminopelargonate synthetase-like enzyme
MWWWIFFLAKGWIRNVVGSFHLHPHRTSCNPNSRRQRLWSHSTPFRSHLAQQQQQRRTPFLPMQVGKTKTKKKMMGAGASQGMVYGGNFFQKQRNRLISTAIVVADIKHCCRRHFVARRKHLDGGLAQLP